MQGNSAKISMDSVKLYKEGDMEILPAWLIEEIKKMDELKRQRERPRLYVELPLTIPPNRHKHDVDMEPQPDIAFSFI